MDLDKVSPFTFMNCKCRTICRVIEFHLHQLEQFCAQKEVKPWPVCPVMDSGHPVHPSADGMTESISEEESQGGDINHEVCGSQHREWEFKFALLVQGKGGAIMRLVVDGKSIRYGCNRVCSLNTTFKPSFTDQSKPKPYINSVRNSL